MESLQNLDWVRGPNMQFLKTGQALESKEWGDYGAWFLMEMDSIPRANGWLDSLLQEVNSRSPIGILGSFFRGDSFDTMDLPEEIQMHINGNAVYNSSNPLLRSFLQKLAVLMVNNAVTRAFDVLLAQHYLSQELRAAEFSWYDGDSAVIGNYAHTAMVEEFYNGEKIVHGGSLYESWKPDVPPLALVVSDFDLMDESGRPALDKFTEQLVKGHNPFREVVVMRKFSKAKYFMEKVGPDGLENITFLEVGRNLSTWLDWCSAPVSSPYFMYTNTFFDFGRAVVLLRSLNDPECGKGKPVVIFTDSESKECLEHMSCKNSVRHAIEFAGVELKAHVANHLMVFETATRDAFCAEWMPWWANRTRGPAQLNDPIYGPNADDYIAFTLKHKKWNNHCWKNSSKHKPRPCGVVNGTVCDTISNEDDCKAIKGCHWHKKYETCSHGKPRKNKVPPKHNVTHHYPEGCQSNMVMPKLKISSEEVDALDVSVEFAGPITMAVTDGAKVVSLDSPATVDLLAQQVIPTATIDNDVMSGMLTVKFNSITPRLVEDVPYEAFDLSGWTVETDYSGSTMTVTTVTTGATLLADQPVQSATATELVLNSNALLKDGATVVNVEVTGVRGARKVPLKKCCAVNITIVTQTPTMTATPLVPSPSRSPSRRASSSRSPSPRATPNRSPSPNPSSSRSPSQVASGSPSSSPSRSPMASRSPSRSASPLASDSRSPSQMRSPSRSPSPEASKSPKSSSPSPMPSKSSSQSPLPSPANLQVQASQSASASRSPSIQPSPYPAASNTQSPSRSRSASRLPSRSPSTSQPASPQVSASRSPASRSPSPSPGRRVKSEQDASAAVFEEEQQTSGATWPAAVAGTCVAAVVIAALLAWVGVHRHRKAKQLEQFVVEDVDLGMGSLAAPNCTPMVTPLSANLAPPAKTQNETASSVPRCVGESIVPKYESCVIDVPQQTQFPAQDIMAFASTSPL